MLVRRSGFMVFVAVAMLAVGASPAAGATFQVISIADAADTAPGNGVCATSLGVCTLRAAMQEANATPGIDAITFAIGSGPQQITIGSPLPTLVYPVTIDGTTQPGYASSPLVTLYGGGTVTGLVIAGGNSVIRSLVFAGFVGHGLRITGNGGNTIERSYIGVLADGTSSASNFGSGIFVDESPNNVIRYSLISSNLGDLNTTHSGGIVLSGPASTGNLILSNLIGTDITGLRRLGNLGRGIAVRDAPTNTIRGNVISANFGSGLRIYGTRSTGTLVEGNYIGIGADATLRGVGNFAGVQIRSDYNIVRNNLIAGNEDSGVLIWDREEASGDPQPAHGNATGNYVYANSIAFNNQNGVAVFAGVGNLIWGNAIYSNRLTGIDVSATVGPDPTGLNPFENAAGDGDDTNDVGDVDGGPNEGQNYPVITSATFAETRTIINVSISSVANATIYVHLFASPSCDTTGNGEGRYPLGYATALTDAAGNATLATSFDYDLRSYALTATATNRNGSTSEFSGCQTVQ